MTFYAEEQVSENLIILLQSFLERALEITGGKNVKISLTKFNNYELFLNMEWK